MKGQKLNQYIFDGLIRFLKNVFKHLKNNYHEKKIQKFSEEGLNGVKRYLKIIYIYYSMKDVIENKIYIVFKYIDSNISNKRKIRILLM